MIENIIECNQLSKIYKKQRALDALNLNIAKGEIFGLIGQNGAGKSTMMKLLAGLIHPSEGNFRLFGKDPDEDPYVYRRIGTLIEQPDLYGNMTGIESMRIKALAMGCNDETKLIELMNICGLKVNLKKKVKSYSLGMKQRLGLALSMIGDPELLILDEPVNGLDPQGINDIRKAILRLNHERNVTILLSSHILEELSKIATSYGIIKDGILIQQMSREELDNSCKDYCLLKTEDVKKASIILEEKCGLNDFKVINSNCIHIFEKIETSMINEILVKNNVHVSEIMMHKQNLEEYFLNITGGKAHVE
ncbi:MAG: ATP-binding cassette domain-containing protein [Bacilli bacterium]|nr:ATP-binding cassette domain-containing protein [Bacilli bacterium]